MYDVTWHLLTLGCYGSFGYCDTTEALQADTEQRSVWSNAAFSTLFLPLIALAEGGALVDMF